MTDGIWMDIFKGGKQTDMAGETHDGNVLIAQALSAFNPAQYQPPIVIGHPKQADPAYGWITDLKTEMRDGELFLLGYAEQIDPEFQKAVETGRYKNRSAAFFEDGSLQHLGFLGAVPPAVSGLGQVQFSHSPDGFIYFSQAPNDGPEEEKPIAEENKEQNVSQGDSAMAEAIAKLAAKDAEIASLKAMIEDLQKQLAAKEAEQTEAEISDLVEEFIEEGKVPADTDPEELKAFMRHLKQSQNGHMQFSAGTSLYDWFKDQFQKRRPDYRMFAKMTEPTSIKQKTDSPQAVNPSDLLGKM